MGNGLRIAVISSGLGHVARGIETWAGDTARVLHGMGENVTLFKGSGRPETDYEVVCSCLRRGGTLNKELNKILPGPFWRLGLGSDYDIEQTTFALNLVPKLRREFDIVHTQDPLCALILQRARKYGLIKAPTILAHGTEEPFEFLEKIEFLQHLAPFHLEEARKAGCHRDGWTAIGNFVDVETFKPRAGASARSGYGVAEDSFVVLTVAAVKRHHKRLDYLIRETADFRQATGAKVELVVAGAKTDETDDLVSLGRERLGEAAHFLLNRPREKMPGIYGLGDVFALCSIKEMMPIALLEAAASGLPCLVSTHPVVNWMIGPGGEGIPMERDGALSTTLRACLDEEYRRKKGAAAREHAVAHFSKEAIAEKYLAMYQDVLARAEGSRRS